MSREAMQMALEALESDPISHAGIVSRKQAITALRQALETEQEPREAMKQPEALRLADALDAEFVQGRISNSTGRESAVELRRLYEVNQDVLKALNTILNISLIDNGHWAKTIEREAHEAIAKATGGEV